MSNCTEKEAALLRDLNNRFTYHAPKEGQALKYEDIRERARIMALMLCKICPESCERALALTKLEEAVFWANAAIARNE